MNYSQKIYELRRKEDISQEALAAAIGTTRQQISRWECGVSVPAPKFAYALAKHFGITVEELFGETVEAKEEDIDDKTSFDFKSKVIIFSVLSFFNFLLMVFLGFFSNEIAKSLYEASGAIKDAGVDYDPGTVNGAINNLKETICLMGLIWIVISSILLLSLFALLFVRNIKMTKNKLICSEYTSSFALSFISFNSALIAGALVLTVGQHMSYLPPQAQFFGLFDGLIFLIGSIFMADVLVTFLKAFFHKPLQRVAVLPEWKGKRKVFDVVYIIIGFLLTIIFAVIGAFSYSTFYIVGFVYFPLAVVLTLVHIFVCYFPHRKKV